MRTKTQFYLLVTLLLFLFIQCKKNLEELPSNIDISIKISSVNQATLEAEVDNVGNLEILGAGFFYSKNSFDCNDLVQEIRGSYNATTKKISASRKADSLSLDTKYFFRAYVEVINPITKQSDRICSLPIDEVTDAINLSTNYEIIDRTVKLNFVLNGLEDDAVVEEYGHYWITSDVKLEEPEINFEQATKYRLSEQGVLRKDVSIFYEPTTPFELGTFYYVQAYAIYDGKLIESTNQPAEIFIGNYWERINTLPNPNDACRLGAVAFSIGGYGFYGTGKWFEDCRLDNEFAREHRNDFWKYDPVADVWDEISPFPGAPREDATAFVIGDRAFVGLGRNNTIQFNDFWEYDFRQDVWTEKDTFPVYRRSAMSFVINEEAYVGTGWSCEPYPNPVRCYYSRRLYKFLEQDSSKGVDSLGKPKGNWVIRALLPEVDRDGTSPARRSASGFAIGDKGYMTLGLGPNNFRSDIWEYDPTGGVIENGELLGSWTRMAELPASGREQGIAFSIGKYGYAGLGGQYGTPSDIDFWRFDPLANDWLRLADVGDVNDIIFRRQDAVSFVIGETAYVGSGNITENIEVADNQFFKYIPNQE